MRGRYDYGISGLNSVSVINLSNNLLEQTITDMSFNQPYTITINPAGTKAYVTNSNATNITIIDIATNTITGTINGFDGPSGMVISPDGNIGYVNNYGSTTGVGSGNGTTVRAVNLITNSITGSAVTVGLAPAALAMTSDGAFVYTINYVDGNPGTGTMSKIRTSDNTVVATISGFSGPFAIAITPDDNFAYITNFGSNNFEPIGTTVSVVDLSTNSVSTINLFSIQPAGIAITPDGKYAYITNYNTLYAGSSFTNLTPGQGTINIIHIATQTVLSPTISVGQSPANIAISPNGEFAYISNFVSNTVNVVALPTFQIVAQGSQIKNRYITRVELANYISWTVTGTSLPINYAIYTDANLTNLLGIILADQPFTIVDHNRQAGITYTYYIVGTNQVGTVSDPVILTIPN